MKRRLFEMRQKLLKPIVCMLLAIMTVVMPLSASAASLVHIVKVNVTDARLRAETGDGSIVKTLSKGTKLLYMGEKKGRFCKVLTGKGLTGYVYQDFLSDYGTVKKSMLYYTEKSTPIYKKSGKSLKRNGSLAKNTLVLVYKTNDSWAYVKSMNGKSGYCRLSYLDDLF